MTSRTSETCTPVEVGTDIHVLHDALRCPLVGGFTYDIDCANSDVRLVCSLATQLDLCELVPTVMDCRDQREKWLKKIAFRHAVTAQQTKRLPTIIINGGRYDTWLQKVGLPKTAKHPEIQTFAKKLYFELPQALRDQLLHHPRFRWTQVDRKSYLDQGRHPNVIPSLLMPRIIASCENDVLTIIHRTLFTLGWRVRAKVFDGLIIEPPSNNPDCHIQTALAAAEAACRAQGWDIRLLEKPLYGFQDDLLPSLASARAASAAVTEVIRSINQPYLPGGLY